MRPSGSVVTVGYQRPTAIGATFDHERVVGGLEQVFDRRQLLHQTAEVDRALDLEPAVDDALMKHALGSRHVVRGKHVHALLLERDLDGTTDVLLVVDDENVGGEHGGASLCDLRTKTSRATMLARGRRGSRPPDRRPLSPSEVLAVRRSPR